MLSFLPFFWGKVCLSFCFSYECKWWDPSRILKSNSREEKGRKGKVKRRIWPSGQMERKWKRTWGRDWWGKKLQAPWRMDFVPGNTQDDRAQYLGLTALLYCSIFLNKQTNKPRDALTGLTENIHLLVLPLELYGTLCYTTKRALEFNCLTRCIRCDKTRLDFSRSPLQAPECSSSVELLHVGPVVQVYTRWGSGIGVVPLTSNTGTMEKQKQVTTQGNDVSAVGPWSPGWEALFWKNQ